MAVTTDRMNERRKASAKAAPARTLGPVSDLERHLPSDWWRTLFNSLYLKTDGDVVEKDENTIEDINMLVDALDLKQDDSILDLCCGHGRHSLELARRGFQNLIGIDRSRYLIRLARRRAVKAGAKVAFREGDARRFRLPENSVSCVCMMGNSFGYFDREEDDRAVLERVKRVLVPGAAIAMDLADGEWMRAHFERRSWEWIDENHFVCRERSLASDRNRLITREVVTHAERGVIADQFYAERLYSFDQIKTLLESIGFESVHLHDAPVTESDRNMDLGMMAHRMFLTARKPRMGGPAAKRWPLFRDVMVLMGDPSLPDSVKREGVFNPEDFETINKMKEALEEAGDYEYRFLDRHANFIPELRENPPEFVLNLCDEGFENDAFKELHVPALLEMLGIPYTGAGPACLGVCYDKALVRAVAQSLDIPVPLETYFGSEDQVATLPSVFPALLKPNFGDSSLGIMKDAVVRSKEELVAYWEKLRRMFPNRSLLIQEFLEGPEYSVGIIGNPGLSMTVLPILEVDYSGLDPELPQILGYESKWLPDSPYWNDIRYKKAEITPIQAQRLIDMSILLFERLACRDYARMDFRSDKQGKIKLLEVNPNPGWCWDGKFNLMAALDRLTYSDMLRLVMEAAQERIAGDGVRPH